MTIQLGDAIERAKLATDESGMLASYTYNRLVEALSDEEQYPFTMALVELGIQTKYASFSRAERQEMQDFLEDNPEEPEVRAVVSFADKLAKAAQTFTQSPGGLWTPESWQEEELTEEDLEEVTYRDLEEDDEEYEEVAPEDILEEIPLDEFSEYDDPEYVGHIREVLERAGISVDAEGNVNFYQSNLPGIYTEQIPMKPMPLDLAYQKYYQSFTAAQKEQTKVKGLLDAVSRMTPEMSDLLETTDFLADMKFSPQSKNKLVQSIAVGLEDLNQILTDPDWYRIQPLLDEIKGNLETYTQGYTTQEESSYEVLDALDRLKDLRENDPQKFQEAVGGYGALGAFRKKHQVEDGDLPYVEINIGRDYIKQRVNEENPALRGEMLEEEIEEWVDFFRRDFQDTYLGPSDLHYMEDVDVVIDVVLGDSYQVIAEFFERIPVYSIFNEEVEEDISKLVEQAFEGVYE